MAEILWLVSIIVFIAAGSCLVVAIIVCIRFKIPSVISDLSGKSSRAELFWEKIDALEDGKNAELSQDENETVTLMEIMDEIKRGEEK